MSCYSLLIWSFSCSIVDYFLDIVFFCCSTTDLTTSSQCSTICFSSSSALILYLSPSISQLLNSVWLLFFSYSNFLICSLRVSIYSAVYFLSFLILHSYSQQPILNFSIYLTYISSYLEFLSANRLISVLAASNDNQISCETSFSCLSASSLFCRALVSQSISICSWLLISSIYSCLISFLRSSSAMLCSCSQYRLVDSLRREISSANSSATILNSLIYYSSLDLYTNSSVYLSRVSFNYVSNCTIRYYLLLSTLFDSYSYRTLCYNASLDSSRFLDRATFLILYLSNSPLVSCRTLSCSSQSFFAWLHQLSSSWLCSNK